MRHLFRRPKPEWGIVQADEHWAEVQGLPVRFPAKPSVAKTYGDVDPDQVLAWAREFAAKYPQDAMAKSLAPFLRKGALLDQVVPALENGQWDKARPLLEEILSLYPGDVRMRLNLGTALRHLGDLQGSLEQYRRCEDVMGNDDQFLVNRARTFEALGEKDRAIADYEKGLELRPNDREILESLARLGAYVVAYADVSDPSSKGYVKSSIYEARTLEQWNRHIGDVKYMLEQAHGHLLDKRPHLALAAADRALKFQANNADAWLYRGIALFKLKRLEEAETTIRHHLELLPQSAWGYANLAKVIWLLQGRTAALPYLEKALELNPNDEESLATLVLPEEEAGGYTASIAKTREWIARHPDAWGPWSVLAQLYLNVRSRENALAAFAEAARRNANDSVLEDYFGLLGVARRYAKLCAIADQITDLPQRSFGLRWNVARGYAAAGRESDARRILEQMANDQKLIPQWKEMVLEALAEFSKTGARTGQ
jgi:tetratricopeptide (TPR) repeat protein